MFVYGRNEPTVYRRLLALVLIAFLFTLTGWQVALADTPAIAKAKQEAQALSALIDKLDNDLSKVTEDYDYANQQLSQTQASVKTATAALSTAQADLRAAKNRLIARLVQIYKNGGTGGALDVLLSASSFSDLMNRFDQLKRIGAQDAQVVQQVKTYTAQVADRQAELMAQSRQEANDAAKTAEAKQKVLAQLAVQKQALKGKEAQVAELQKQEAARQAQLAAAAKAAAAAAARKAALQAAAAESARAASAAGPSAAGPSASRTVDSSSAGGSSTTAGAHAVGTGSNGGGSGGGLSAGSTSVPASSLGAKVVQIAMQYLGVPYVWAGSSPSGFDCSGLVMFVYAKVGVNLPHSSAMQYGYGTPVARNQLQPGDLVFFYNPIHHVGIYIGNGQMINARGSEVQIDNLWTDSYHGARRIL